MLTYEPRFQALFNEGHMPHNAAFLIGYEDGKEGGARSYNPPIIPAERAAYVRGLELGRHDHDKAARKPA